MAIEIIVPDIGTDGAVDVIEVMVNPGDSIDVDDSIITLESDKASMEVPASDAGVVKEIKVKVGDKVSQGDLILVLEGDAAEAPKAEQPAAKEKTAEEKPSELAKEKQAESKPSEPAADGAPGHDGIYAGPGVRRLAREFGLDLSQIAGSGRKGRIVKADVQAYVKQRMAGGGGGVAVAAAPSVDFSKFGEIEVQPLNKIKRLTGEYTHRSWVTVPHVTQFDEADITELDAFRKAQKDSVVKQHNVKLTPLAFIMKAVAKALHAFPQFNASLSPNGSDLILKKYCHIGVAVDTPNGLVVPVIRDVDQKGVVELAGELAEISKKAREKGLTPKEMAGSCMTISSLGGIGGTAFTPIVNAPDVAILGVSKAKMQPVYQDGDFVPRLMLPLSLSYDHRVIDGAEAARFTTFLAQALSDIRTLIL